jgi:hypothetical protein
MFSKLLQKGASGSVVIRECNPNHLCEGGRDISPGFLLGGALRFREYSAWGTERKKNPEYPWTTGTVPRRYWEDKTNHKKYLEWLAAQLGLKTREDWYKVKQSDFASAGGSSLLSKFYRNIPMNAVVAVYDDHQWDVWRFEKLPGGFWEKKETQVKYMDWLGQRLGYTSKEGWYKTKLGDFVSNWGWGLLHMHGNMPSKVVMSVYDDRNWEFWKFEQLPKGTWDDKANQRKYLDWLFNKLGYKTPEDWYKVKILDFAQNYGWSVIYAYENTPAKAIAAHYKEIDWELWRFDPMPRDFWDEKINHRRFMDWLGTQLGYKERKDYYYLTHDTMSKNNALGLVAKHRNSVIDTLRDVYPEHNWETSEFQKAKEHMAAMEAAKNPQPMIGKRGRQLPSPKPFQEDLKTALREIFPSEDLLENFHHPDLFSNEMEFDVYMPKLKLGFKYFSEQQYRLRRKNTKMHEACSASGITLIDIPYWWNKEKNSLFASIARHRPELLTNKENWIPIPSLPPSTFKFPS